MDLHFRLMPLAVALVTTVATVPLSIYLARVLGLMDQPNARKVHKAPTPRLGGIAIIGGMLVSVVATFICLRLLKIRVTPQDFQVLLAISGAGVFIFLVGLVDDIRSISSSFKLLSILAGAAMVCGSGAVIGGLWFGGKMLLNMAWVNWALTILWIVGIAVAVNFIDGLDGLAAGLTLLSAAVLSVFLMAAGQFVAAIIPLALVGSLTGFLFFNWHPAKTFMGDCGSLTIGFIVASSMVVANPLVGTMRGIILPSLALSIPILDAALTMFRRRYQQRRSIFSAERGHIHHQMLDRGLSHLQVVLTIYFVSILAVAIGLIALSMEGWSTIGGFAMLIPLFFGTFRFAGSVRTDEMIQALRRTRQIDRTSKRDRDSFESLQLEFNNVTTVSQWWQAVCRAAERLEFVKVEIDFGQSKSRGRRLVWESDNDGLVSCDRIHSTIPVAERKSFGGTVPARIEIAVTDSLELAGKRMMLFSRLMSECSLQSVRKKESNLRSNKSTELASDPSKAELEFEGEFGHLRVAVVHDFLYTYCGAEKVLEQLIEVFPHCDVFALFDFLPEEEREFLRDKPVTTSFIQNMPFARSKHRSYLPLMPFAVEQLDVSGYDLVISSSYLVAKGVITGPDQMHICYCHSPVRYAWDLQHRYLDDGGYGFGPRGLIARAILHYLRNWDVRSAVGVDHFIANSQFIARRIDKAYRRKAKVIHPPVDTGQFEVSAQPREDFYIVAGRMVPYKSTTMIVEAFARMPERRLVVIGDGPDMPRVSELAGANVELLGYQSSEKLIDYMQRAKALLFAAEEDFGIVPVEALSCGTPVIAYNKGGVTESVLDGQHGVFFDEQTVESLVEAIERFEAQNEFSSFDPSDLHRRSTEFSSERFRKQIAQQVKTWTQKRWSMDAQPGSPSTSEEVSKTERNQAILPTK